MIVWTAGDFSPWSIPAPTIYVNTKMKNVMQDYDMNILKCTFSVFGKRIFWLSIIRFSWHLQLDYVTQFIFKTEEVYRKVRHISLPATTVSNKSLKFFGRQLWNEFRTSSYEFYNECFNFVYVCHQSCLLVAWGMKYRRKKTRFDSDCRGSP